MCSSTASASTASVEVEVCDDHGAVHSTSIRRTLQRRLFLILALIVLLIGATTALVILAMRLSAREGSSCRYDAPVEVSALREEAISAKACEAHAHVPNLTMPDGMLATVYACGLIAPRQLTPVYIDGLGVVLFVGTRKWGRNSSVYAVLEAPAANDGAPRSVAGTVVTIDTELDQPNGVEWMGGELYVATARALLRYEGVIEVLRGRSHTTFRRVLHPAAFPALSSMQWHYLRANAGVLYASNSAGCDHCLPQATQAASIVRLEASSCYEPTVHISGVRFSVGLTFDQAGALYFTNNAHDSIDGDRPWDTINRAPSSGAHFGFPHCYVTADGTLNASAAAHLLSGYSSGYDIGDHAARLAQCEQRFSRGVPIGYHSAPLGVCFRDEGSLLIAERGAFRGSTAGHQISTVNADLTGFQPLITGFIHAQSGVRWGRPVDVQMDPLKSRSGSGRRAFYVSDDYSGSILRFENSAASAR